MSSYKKIRLYLKLTQQEIADVLGMFQSGWQQVEAGNVSLPDEKKKILHRKYGISYKFMIEGMGNILDGNKKSSRTITIEINGKKHRIKESELQAIKIIPEKDNL